MQHALIFGCKATQIEKNEERRPMEKNLVFINNPLHKFEARVARRG